MHLFCDYIPKQKKSGNSPNSHEFNNFDNIIFLHGFLASSSNLKSFAKKFSYEGYDIYLPDFRNHGLSPHRQDMSYSLLSHDINQLMIEKRIKQTIICGHSMGGKVAIQFAIDYPEKVKKLVILDISPEKRDVREMRHIVKILSQVDLKNNTNRNIIREELLHKLRQASLVDFLLKNLISSPELKWRSNIDLFNKNIDFLESEITQQQPLNIETLFVKGENSEYITENSKKKIDQMFKNYDIEIIPNTGHWIHYEQPEYLFKVLNKFFNNHKNTN